MRGRLTVFVATLVVRLVFSGIIMAQGSGVLCITEQFTDTVFPPPGWTADGVTRVTTTGSYVSAPAAANIGTYNGTLTLPPVSSPVSLTFQLGRTTSATVKMLIVEVGTAGLIGGFVPLDTFDHQNTPSGSFQQFSVNLTGWSMEPAVWIRFRKSSTTTSPWRIDDIEVYNSPPLPVHFASFRAEAKEQGSAILYWITAGEWNNAGFMVESSGDGMTFLPIGYVPGNGTTQVPRHYQFTDLSPELPVTYYRLRQQDYDGREEVTSIIECRLNTVNQGIELNWIQAFREGIWLQIQNLNGEDIRIALYDPGGRNMYTSNTNERGTIEFSAQVKLSEGIHVLVISSTQKTLTRKFFVDF